MKYTFSVICVLLCLVLMAQCQSKKQIVKSIRQCKEDVGATEDILGLLKEGNLPETKTSFCAIACACKKIGVMAENNSIIPEATKKVMETLHLKTDKADTVIETCKTEVGEQSDECEAAKTLMTCLHQHKE